MNLRQKFIWNIVLAVSSIVLIWHSYYQFYEHLDIRDAYRRFNDEEVGTDKELQKMILDLEENLSSRQNMKFRLKENPLELTKVIRFDGSNTALTGQKGIDCKAAWSNGDGTFSTSLSLLTGVEYGYNFNNSDGSGYESGYAPGDESGDESDDD